VTQLLQDTDALWISLALLAVMVAVHEVCWRLGAREAKRAGSAGDDALGPLASAASLLMGLILAFSFSMASNRAVQRADLVVDEANAIGSAWLRCGLLDAESRDPCRAGLRRYVDLRLEIHETGYDVPRLMTLVAESEAVLDDLWKGLLATAHRVGPNPYVSLVLAAMNDVVDRHGERLASARRYVPAVVTLLELGLCVVWAGFTGYSLGLRGRHYRFGWTVFAVLIVIVIYVTFDFDRQQRGQIRQQAAYLSLYELRESMGRP
jgi:hypothetical protein